MGVLASFGAKSIAFFWTSTASSNFCKSLSTLPKLLYAAKNLGSSSMARRWAASASRGKPLARWAIPKKFHTSGERSSCSINSKQRWIKVIHWLELVRSSSSFFVVGSSLDDGSTSLDDFCSILIFSALARGFLGYFSSSSPTTDLADAKSPNFANFSAFLIDISMEFDIGWLA